jgi:hypothetical protein
MASEEIKIEYGVEEGGQTLRVGMANTTIQPSGFYSRPSVRYGRMSAGMSAGRIERHST